MQRIFVSSTFRDMNLERDAIGQLVQPELNAIAHQYGESVGFCDLRWGINTTDLESDAGSKKVLSVCLDEIDNCRPYMIVLLGERYGWIPHASLIQNAVMDRPGFQLDELEKSVTALEIEYGALHRQEQLKRTLFYFRELVGQPPEEYQAESQRHAEKLRSLKQRILALAGSRVKSYQVTWDEAEQTMLGLDAFADMVVEDMRQLLEGQWKDLSGLSPMEKDQRSQWDYGRYKAAQFTGRHALYRDVLERMNTGRLLAIRGGTGSGKSTLLSYMALQMQEKQTVLPIFCGTSAACCTAMDVLRYIVEFIENQLSLPPSEEASFSGADRWQERLAEVTALYEKNGERPLRILVDGVDQLIPDELRDKLLFVPTSMTGKVSMIVSCLDSFPLPASVPTLSVGQLKAEDRATVIHGILQSVNRELDSRVIDAMVSKKSGGNPLFLSLLIQRLTMMDREDFANINARGGQMEAITQWQLQLIEGCADSLEALSVQLSQEAARRVGGRLALDAIGYLAVSRYGLREMDLLALLEGDSLRWQSLDFSRFLRYMGNFFILRQDGRWDFTHKCFREGLRRMVTAKDRHRRIYEQLLCLEENDPIRIRELAYHCICCDQRSGFVAHTMTCQKEAAAQAGEDLILLAREDNGAWLLQILESDDLCADVRFSCFLMDCASGAFHETLKDQQLKLKIMMGNLAFARRCLDRQPDAKTHKVVAQAASMAANAQQNMGTIHHQIHAVELMEEAVQQARLHRDLLMQDAPEDDVLEASLFLLTQLSEQGQHYTNMRSPEALEAGMQILEKAVRECDGLQKTPNSQKTRIRLYCALAENLVLKKYNGKALLYFQKALALVDEAGNEDDRVYLLDRIYNTHRQTYRSSYSEPDALPKLRNFEPSADGIPTLTPRQAVEYLEESYRISQNLAAKKRRVQDRMNLAISCQNMARCYRDTEFGQGFKQQLQLWEQSLKIVQQLAEELNTVEIRRNLHLICRQVANVYLNYDPERSAALMHKAVAECEKLHIQLDTFGSMHELAFVYQSAATLLYKIGGAESLLQAAVWAEKSAALYGKLFYKNPDTRRRMEASKAFMTARDCYQSLGDRENTARVCGEQDAFLREAEKLAPANPFDF